MTFAESGRRFVTTAGWGELGVERGDPVVNQLETRPIHNLRAEVGHATSAELGHAIEQDRAVGGCWGHHAGCQHAESALGGTGAEEVGLFEGEVVPDVHGSRAAATTAVARGTVGVQVRPGTSFQRKGGVPRVGHRGRDLGQRGGDQADVSHRADLVVDNRAVIVVTVELGWCEPVDRASTGRVAEDAFGAAGVVPRLHSFPAGGGRICDGELAVGSLVVGQDGVGSGVVPDVVVRLPRLAGVVQYLGFNATSRTGVTGDQVQRNRLGQNAVNREGPLAGDVTDLDVR